MANLEGLRKGFLKALDRLGHDAGANTYDRNRTVRYGDFCGYS